MTGTSGGFAWKVIVDGPRRSRVWDGQEPTTTAVVSAMLHLAREAYRVTPPEEVLGLRVGVAPGIVVEHLLRLTPNELDLGVDEVTDRIEVHAARAIEDERERQRRLDAAIASRRPVVRRRPSTSLAGQWDRILRWLDAHATAGTVGGGDLERTTATRAAAGLVWPADLVEFHDLVHSTARLTPRGHLFTLDDALAVRRDQIEARDAFAATVDGGDPFAVAESNADPAGTDAFAFLDAFVPLAGDEAGFYVVDTRPGLHHGCVVDIMDEGDSAMRWPGLADLLADLALSLETGARFADLWVPRIMDGELSWEIP